MKDISLQELRELLDSNEDFFLIDVREREELRYGMLPRAVSLPLSELAAGFMMDGVSFQKKFSFRKPKVNERIIVYCRSGNRSARAVLFLRDLGFVNAQNFRGSVLEWSKVNPSVSAY